MLFQNLSGFLKVVRKITLQRLCEAQNRIWISKTVRDMTMILFSSYRSSPGGIESANHFLIQHLDFSLALHKVMVFHNVEGVAILPNCAFKICFCGSIKSKKLPFACVWVSKSWSKYRMDMLVAFADRYESRKDFRHIGCVMWPTKKFLQPLKVK